MSHYRTLTDEELEPLRRLADEDSTVGEVSAHFVQSVEADTASSISTEEANS